MANRRERRRSQREADDTLVDIVEVTQNAQGFIEKNQKTILGVATLILGAIAAILLYNTLVKGPKADRAKAEIYKAEQQFAVDSFALALSNPGAGYDGFLDIIENYKGTPTANTAKYYAGVSYLNLGDYDNAISYLNDVKPKGDILSSMKYGNLGDAYSEKNEWDTAISNYRKAVTSGKNDALKAYYLMKLGRLLERQGNKDEALKSYKEIRDNYHDSQQAQGIEKYISRLEA